jgi:hypothetical protein
VTLFPRGVQKVSIVLDCLLIGKAYDTLLNVISVYAHRVITHTSKPESECLTQAVFTPQLLHLPFPTAVKS